MYAAQYTKSTSKQYSTNKSKKKMFPKKQKNDICTCSMSLSAAPVLLRSEVILFTRNRKKSINQKQWISKLKHQSNTIYNIHYISYPNPSIHQFNLRIHSNPHYTQNWRAPTAQNPQRSSNPPWLELNRALSRTITLLLKFTRYSSNVNFSCFLFRHRLAPAEGGTLWRNEAIEKWKGECTDARIQVIERSVESGKCGGEENRGEKMREKRNRRI